MPYFNKILEEEIKKGRIHVYKPSDGKNCNICGLKSFPMKCNSRNHSYAGTGMKYEKYGHYWIYPNYCAVCLH